MARAPATRCGRLRSEAPCCPGRTPCTKARCPRCRGQQLLRTRARFLADCGWGRQQALLSSLERRDQLQLLDVLALAHAEEAEPELIVIGSFPGKPSFAGLGELTASELETLWPARRRAAPASLEAAFLAPALRRLLEELPAPVDGLSGTERRALQAVPAGAHTPPAAFVAAQRLEDAPFLGDAWFYRALSALPQGETRLLATDEGTSLLLSR